MANSFRLPFDQLIRTRVPLAPMTTLGIGGPAQFFASANSVEHLVQGVQWARDRDLPLFVLGGGSNVVISDSGFPGLVLRVDIRGLGAEVRDQDARIIAGAGEEWDAIVATTVERGWAGLECLSGIPGRVGATPIQNVGAYGQEISETMEKVEALDLETNQLVQLNSTECGFGYRTSRFKTSDKQRFIITSVMYRLRIDSPPTIRYAELERRLSSAGSEPGLADVRRAVLEIRRSKAMVIDPADPDSMSVGSFFVNPILTRNDFERLKSNRIRSGERSESIPGFPQEDGTIKTSAAWLIEHAGIERGFVHGNVGISRKHALAIINRGGGTAAELLELKNLIQARVRDKLGIELVPEPVFVGFDGEDV